MSSRFLLEECTEISEAMLAIWSLAFFFFLHRTMVLLHPLPTQRHDCHCTRTHTFTFQQMYTDYIPSLVKTVPKCLVVIFISPPLLQPHLSLTKLPGPESHLCGLRKAESREAVDCSLPPWGICLASLLPVIQENVAPELSVICPVTYCHQFQDYNS